MALAASQKREKQRHTERKSDPALWLSSATLASSDCAGNRVLAFVWGFGGAGLRLEPGVGWGGGWGERSGFGSVVQRSVRRRFISKVCLILGEFEFNSTRVSLVS